MEVIDERFRFDWRGAPLLVSLGGVTGRRARIRPKRFDDWKHQWGWTGFTTQDHQRCQILARIVALLYNWWSLLTRLAIPNRHTEATTSRPLLLHGIGRQATHANQATLTITSNHAPAEPIRQAPAPAVHFPRLAQNAPPRSGVPALDRRCELPDLG